MSLFASTTKDKAKVPSKIVAVLDAGTAKIGCFIARISGEDGKLEILGWAVHRSNGFKSGSVVDMQKATRALRSTIRHAETVAGCSINHIGLHIGCGRVRSDILSIDLPLQGRVPDADIMAAASAQAMKLLDAQSVVPLHLVPLSWQIDDQPESDQMPTHGGQSLRVKFHVVLADRTPVETLSKAVRDCGLEPYVMAASSFASAVAVLTAKEAADHAVCIDIGAGLSSLAMFSGGNLIFVDSLALGGNNLTSDIARLKGLSFDDAEQLKLALSNPSELATASANPVEIEQIIRPRVVELFETLEGRVTRAGFPSLCHGRLILTGGGSHLAGLVKMVQFALPGCQFEIREPVRYPGFSEFSCGPAFAAVHGLLKIKSSELQASQAETTSSNPPQDHKQTDADSSSENSYAKRVSRWLRESF